VIDAVRFVLLTVLLLLGSRCGGVPSTETTVGDTAVQTDDEDEPELLWESTEFSTEGRKLLAKVTGASRDLRMDCGFGRCMLVWSDHERLYSLLRSGASDDGELLEIRRLGERADAKLRCSGVQSYKEDRWAVLVTSVGESSDFPAILVIDDSGEVVSRFPLPRPDGTIVDADFSVHDGQTLVTVDAGDAVHAFSIVLSNGRTGPIQRLSGKGKSSADQIFWGHGTFWVAWSGWPKHQNPTLHATRWDRRETVDLPYMQDHALRCRGDGCIMAGETDDGSLTIAPIDLATGELGAAQVSLPPIEGDPYAETALFEFHLGHLVVARRAWSDEVKLIVVKESGEPVAPFQRIEQIGRPPYVTTGGGIGCEAIAWGYASAWFQPPADYEPVDMDGPDGETLTTIPETMDLWFQTFSVALPIDAHK